MASSQYEILRSACEYILKRYDSEIKPYVQPFGDPVEIQCIRLALRFADHAQETTTPK